VFFNRAPGPYKNYVNGYTGQQQDPMETLLHGNGDDIFAFYTFARRNPNK